ncbi:MAG: Asp-tRNA(Asn)/Glu-tRNA(Gln) amidotransferase subunit GatC [Rhodospirillales bacterium]|nr:Asp-tRNA(Asn)/Glu-tRNA(Gln) amidotransferase subunit GatC [Rhodospirillales bacterium]
MTVDKETVRHIARLARIRIDEAEEEILAKDLGGILQWIDVLQAVDTEGVAPMTSAVATELKLREDAVDDGNAQEAVLKNAPDRMALFYSVPKVVE